MRFDTMVKMALSFIKETGFKKGMTHAHKIGLNRESIDKARKMAIKDPKKYLPEWHFLAKAERELKAQKMFNIRHKKPYNPYRSGRPNRHTTEGQIAEAPTPPEFARRMNLQEETLMSRYPEYRRKVEEMVKKSMQENAKRRG
jgi:hypothetical protein